MSAFTKFLYGLVLAACLPALYVLVFLPDEPFSPSSLTLGEGGYEPRLLTAPVATGPLLEAITYALTATRAGPFFRRALLNANGFETMRTLAEQVAAPPLYFPMRRLSAAQLAAVNEEAEQATPLLETALADLPHLDVGFRTVTDYAKQYTGGFQVCFEFYSGIVPHYIHHSTLYCIDPQRRGRSCAGGDQALRGARPAHLRGGARGRCAAAGAGLGRAAPGGAGAGRLRWRARGGQGEAAASCCCCCCCMPPPRCLTHCLSACLPAGHDRHQGPQHV